MRDGCAPDVFFHAIRPWFKGEDSMRGARRWVFEGVGDEDVVREYGECMRAPPKDLSGPSAGQSALVHALNIFLGVDVYSAPSRSEEGEGAASGDGDDRSAGDLMMRMQRYMPRHHRAFLRHLAANPRPLRTIVHEESSNLDLVEAYNAAVTALKTFRDAHIRIVTLYIVGPSRRVEAGKRTGMASDAAAGEGDTSISKGKMRSDDDDSEQEKGTGGTKFISFLKSVRDVTANSVVGGQ